MLLATPSMAIKISSLSSVPPPSLSALVNTSRPRSRRLSLSSARTAICFAFITRLLFAASTTFSPTFFGIVDCVWGAFSRGGTWPILIFNTGPIREGASSPFACMRRQLTCNRSPHKRVPTRACPCEERRLFT